MLQYPKFSQSVNFTSADRAVRTISGRRLNRLVRYASARDRALLALELEQGEVHLLSPTRAQVAALTHASLGYIGTVSRLTADERIQLARGQSSLSRLHNSHRYIATDAAIDRIVAKLGAERIMAALDRATAPSNGS
jgi:hypothetical protein